MREALIETYNEKGAFDQRYCDAIYQAKLRPYIDTGRLVAGAVIAAIGRDPCHAIAAATNALENNFAGPPPEMGGISREILNESGKMTTAVKEALEETIDDIRKNPGEYLKEAAIGSAPYGDIVRKIANGHDVSAIEFGIETGLLFVGPIKGGIKAGGKIAGKLGATYAKKMERGAVKQANHVPASASTKTAKPNAVHNQSTKKTLDSGNAKQKELKKPNKTLPIRHKSGKNLRTTRLGQDVGGASKDKILESASDVAVTAKKMMGRAGKHKRLKELAVDPKLGKADRGWLQQEINESVRGKKGYLRNPPGHDLAHKRGFEAAKGYDYDYSHLQSRDLHKLQHKYDNNGMRNKTPSYKSKQ